MTSSGNSGLPSGLTPLLSVSVPAGIDVALGDEGVAVGGQSPVEHWGLVDDETPGAVLGDVDFQGVDGLVAGGAGRRGDRQAGHGGAGHGEGADGGPDGRPASTTTRAVVGGLLNTVVLLVDAEVRVGRGRDRPHPLLREGRAHVVTPGLTPPGATPTTGRPPVPSREDPPCPSRSSTHHRPFVTDGGLETTLVFHDGIDLPDFAAFPLVDTEQGRATLTRYYTPYLDIAERMGTGIVLDTPTWRASLDWGARLGYDAIRLAGVNHRAVEFVAELARRRPALTSVVNGVIGPRGDGYVVGTTMSASEAAAYHGLQARPFAEAGAAMISAITMTYAAEAIGITRAATAVGLPVVVSFTVETDGRLPSGQSIGDAIAQVDDATHSAPAYFMLNCAHPTHFPTALDPDAWWVARVKGVRANASRLSHAELDEATELRPRRHRRAGRSVRRAVVDARPVRRRRLLRNRPRSRRGHRRVAGGGAVMNAYQLNSPN